MELGVTIAIFIITCILLALVFTLVATYFGHRLRKERINQKQPYSLTDDLESNYEQLEDKEYEEFINKRTEDRQQKTRTIDKKTKLLIQLVNLNEPFHENNQSIYNIQTTKSFMRNFQPAPQTGRSIGTTRSFRPNKLHDFRSKKFQRQDNGGSNNQIENQSKTPKNNEVKKQELKNLHTFVTSLVSYTQEGINIINKNVSMIWQLKNGDIIQKKNCQSNFVKSNSPQFQSILDAHGLEIGNYCAFQCLCTVDLTCITPLQKYEIEHLKLSHTKESIQFAQYYWEKSSIQN